MAIVWKALAWCLTSRCPSLLEMATAYAALANGGLYREPVPVTRADLLAGRDAPLEAALRWIASPEQSVP